MRLQLFAPIAAWLLLASPLFLLPKAVSADTPVSHPPSNTLSKTQRKLIFDLVWTRVRDRHYDPKMNGVDWNAVRVQYEPRALNSPTEGDFYAVLNQMLGELKQSHLGVIPPSDAATLGAERPSAAENKNGVTGLTALLIGGQAVITQVEPKSGAAEAGLKPGFTLVSIDGKPLASLLKRIHDRKPALREGEERVQVWALTRNLLAGPADKKAVITVRATPDAPETNFEVMRHIPTGQILRFGALPPIPSEVESKTLSNGIGYVRFNIFLFPLVATIRKAVQKMAEQDAPGIILDLRGNPGGIGAMAQAIAGLFMDRQTDLGLMQTRAMQLRFPVFPQEPRYKGPLAILTDGSSLSTSEILAGGLQEIKRAVVIGRPSGGMALPSQVEELPGGGEFQYVFADFHTPKGVRLEGRGVQPDIPVELTPESLHAHPDPVLDAAIAYIQAHGTRKTSAVK